MLVNVAQGGLDGTLVRYELLKGLPGEGPIPKELHLGPLTPWSERFVVRFWKMKGGNEWNSV